MPVNSKRTAMKKTHKKKLLAPKPRRSRKQGHDYATLEDRKMLAVTSAFAPGAGILTVNLSANNDIAVVDNDGTNVTVGGSQVTTGIAANDVRRIVVIGNPVAANQQVAFNGNFSGTGLTDIDVSNVNQVTVNGAYDLSNDFDVELIGVGGRVGDGTSGRLRVDGQTTILANNNSVVLDNATNNFNDVRVTTGGTARSVTLADVNSLNFTGVDITGDLTVNAVNGTVSDSPGTTIRVIGDGDFTAANVLLGGTGDETRFQRTSFNVSSVVNVQEDDNTLLGDVTAGSLRLASNGRILDGLTTQINVSGLAELFGNAGVRLGDNGVDVFNAGTVNFQSNGQVSINEDSAINIVGTNTARSMNLRSKASITDDDNATINVQFQSGFTAQSVRIGDTDTDQFNSNSIYFFTEGRFDLSEDSDTLVIEEKNFAQSMRLRSSGQITDEAVARMTITNLAEFDAESAIIGDVGSDFFTAGSIQFDADTQFRLTENNDTNILGTNRAQNSIITSVGNLSNSDNADIVVTNNASFRGNSINVGNQTGDNAQFGSLTFITPNVGIANPPAGFASVNITEDDSTVFGGNSRAGQAADTTANPAIIGTTGNVRIQSGGNITDGSNSSVNVTGNMRMTTANNGNITVGDSGVANGVAFDSTFNTGSLTIDTDGTGNARIFEDSNIFLVGNTQANSLLLDADNGQATITDSATAMTNVNFTLNVRGSFINLGTGVDAANPAVNTDSLTLRSLTFNSSGNTAISADSNINLVGSSTADNLTLASTGNITDTSVTGTAARTIVQTSANFAAVDAIIGEIGDDFFNIVSGNNPGVADVTGTENIVVNRV